MKRSLIIAAIFLLSSCATTKLQSDGSPLQSPLCGDGSQGASISVLWSPKWRPDQKEPPLREAAALRGIEQFFTAQPCIKTLVIHRVALPEQHEHLSEASILAMARKTGNHSDTVILLVVRELGPKLILGLPTLVEGGTEVMLETRVVERNSAASLANLKTQWQKSGPFYIKGVKTLDADMRTVLETIFSARAKDQ